MSDELRVVRSSRADAEQRVLLLRTNTVAAVGDALRGYCGRALINPYSADWGVGIVRRCREQVRAAVRNAADTRQRKD